jgi:magnesium chelatase subunit H
MMPRRISLGEGGAPVRVVVVTMDSNLAGTAAGAAAALGPEIPGLELAVHAAGEWGADGAALAACQADIARADILIAGMLFLEDHIRAVLPALAARSTACDATLCMLSAGEVMRHTRLGRFSMAGEARGPLALLKRLRGGRKGGPASGQGQMRMLKELPRLLRLIPGTAQDVRAYFLALQYWLGGSEENLANLVRLLVNRYAAGPRAALAGTLRVVRRRCSTPRSGSTTRARRGGSWSGPGSCRAGAARRARSGCCCSAPSCWPAMRPITTV